MGRRPFIAIVGHGPELSREEGAASTLRGLGAEVRTADLWDDPATLFEGDDDVARALVIEALDRPDLAAAALRAMRKESRFAGTGALVAVTAAQVARVEPSSGFDDFVLVPYVPAELYARIRTVEWKRSEFSNEERIKVGDIVVDRAARDASISGRDVPLTAKEFALLAYLAERRGKVVSREELLARVWGARYEGGERTVDIHVRRLRAKFGEDLPLLTLRGSGYKLVAPEGRLSNAEPPRAKSASAGPGSGRNVGSASARASSGPPSSGRNAGPSSVRSTGAGGASAKKASAGPVSARSAGGKEARR